MRYIVYTLLAAYLLIVGLWPLAAAPVTLAVTGLNIVLSVISGPALILLVVIGWFRHRNTPRPAVA